MVLNILQRVTSVGYKQLKHIPWVWDHTNNICYSSYMYIWAMWDRHIVKYKSLCQRALLQNQSLWFSRLGDVLYLIQCLQRKNGCVRNLDPHIKLLSLKYLKGSNGFSARNNGLYCSKFGKPLTQWAILNDNCDENTSNNTYVCTHLYIDRLKLCIQTLSTCTKLSNNGQISFTKQWWRKQNNTDTYFTLQGFIPIRKLSASVEIISNSVTLSSQSPHSRYGWEATPHYRFLPWNCDKLGQYFKIDSTINCRVWGNKSSSLSTRNKSSEIQGED